MICIDGIGGIGKTSLALEVVSECLDASKSKLEGKEQIEAGIPLFDGFIWTSAKDRELKLNDMLDAVARTLDWPWPCIAQQPVEEKRESVRKLLQTKKYLPVVDNFETITDESIRDFLLKLPEPSKALITSREQKLPQAWMVSIKGLEQNEALILIRNEGQRLGLKSIENAEDQVLVHLYQATGGAPLAIKWAVGQIKQKGQSLDTVLSALHEAKGDIFEEVFARSWSLLTEDAKKVLMVMPIFAYSASKDAIEAGSDVHHFALDEALGQLVQMWLVEVTDELEAAKRRYSVHPLTRAFGEAKLKINVEVDTKMRTRTGNYFIKFVEQNEWLFDNLEVDKENLLKILYWYYEEENWDNLLKLGKDLTIFLMIRGYWQELIQYGVIGLKAAENQRDKGYMVIILIGLIGWALLKMGDYIRAEQYITQGMEIAKSIDDQKLVAFGIRFLGKSAIEQNRMEEAKILIENAFKIAEQEQYELLKYHLYGDFGRLASYSGDYKEAEFFFKKSLAGFRKMETEHRNLSKLVHLGDILLLQNKKDEANKTYQNFLRLNEKYGRKDTFARAKLGLAKIDEINGNFKEALNQAMEAQILFEKLGMKKYIDEAQTMIEKLTKQLH